MKYALSAFAFGASVALALASARATGDYDCSMCSNLTRDQEKVLASYDNGGKKIICDPTCLDGVTDPTHCNYFGLSQICRGCGDCNDCTPCPSSTLEPTTALIPSPTSDSAPNPTSAPVPAVTPFATSPTSGPTIDYCSACMNLTSAQEEALASYDNGGKKIVCDSTCLDGISDPSHCNYFGLGQICRGCGNCSDCMPCPSTPAGPTLAPGPSTTEAPVSSPIATLEPVTTIAPVPAPTSAATRLTSEPTIDECSACSNLTTAQKEALGSYDNGGKKIVCDPTCLDGVSDPIHCNYFGLGQICRACGNCSNCTPCP